jgi:hypothetical protein
MNLRTPLAVFFLGSAAALQAHDGSHGSPLLDAMIAEYKAAQGSQGALTPLPATAPAGYGASMAASFGTFKPRVRFYWDATTFYLESDNVPNPALMPTPMVGITSWQQQIPLPTSYFSSTTNPERDAASLGFNKSNVWRLPLVPVPSAAPIPISAGNFQRGAVAIAADGIAIFNPRNNTGRVSYEIGELDKYGGHCGLADDYHYHIAPVHLQAVTGIDQPIAWALDGYPIYGYTEPDGSARLPLDSEGGHAHGAWNYHYHAVGSAAAGPQSPYLPTAFHGTVVNYGNQVDGQPEVSAIRGDGTGGYSAKAVAGASIVAFKNPVAFATDAAGNLSESTTGTASPDQYLMRVQIGGSTYDECWRINRNANPKTVTVTWRLPTISPTTTTYNSTGNRLTTYGMAAASLAKLPDTGQTIKAGTTLGQDADYTINAPSFTDNNDGTITDNVTGLIWQKTDNGESTWDTAVSRTATIATGGYSDWRLPTPTELFSIMNHNVGNPAALDTKFFPSNPAGAAEYWWSSDIYGSDATKIWCVNAGGGMGPKPKSETLSAGGTLRYHARYVRGVKPTNGHNYANNLDGTITDLDTGLMWTQVPATARSWTAALDYAENLTLAGYTDWRLPNIKELQTLVDFTLATATTQNGAQAPLNRVLFPTATTPATAYWSSTVLRPGGNNAATQAWLVEFGVNNSVPAANGPTRNAQGLISYEVFASSYAAFAVRGPITAAVVDPGHSTGTARLVNIATRANVGGTFGTPIAGFVIAGAARSVLVRGVGPALTSFGVAGALGDPRLSVVRGDGSTVAANDNWLASDGPAMTAVGAFSLPANSRDAALVSTLAAGPYTAPVTAPAGDAGVALVEVYDTGSAAAGSIVNASTRAFVGTGDSVLIPGFVVGGSGSLRVLVRAVGPGLAGFGLSGLLADPVLTVFRDGAPVATNDNWSTAANAAEIAAAATNVGAFPLATGSRDAAVLVTLTPGAYTAVVSGTGGTTGTALVEIYTLP